VNQLWDFLQNKGIPLTEDGCFLAYKSVRQDFKDHHSGQFDNSPGKVHEMPRNQISDDPRVECHEGFHVGALEYAKNTWSGARLVVCKVDPENVVSVPHDHNSQKMRVCKYEVTGHHNGTHLPSTTFKEDTHDDEGDENEEGEDVDVQDLSPGTDPEPDEFTRDDPKKEKRPSKKGFTRLDKLDMENLLKESIDTLRKYATKGLVITGASKIPGGKVALVAKILEVRA
jgi:hypothetical protein